MKDTLKKLLPIVAVCGVLLALPAPEGMKPEAWTIFAFYVAAIMGLVLRPFPEPVVLLAVIGIGSFWIPPGKLLQGYASTTVWLVFSAFIISQAFIQTGLGKRIAYVLLGRFGRTSLGLGYIMAVTDLVISPATPSYTARSGGIVFPVFRSIAQTLGSEPGETAGKIGAYLTLLMYQISLSTAVIFLTAMSPNALVASFAKEILSVDMEWLLWAKVAFVPGLVVLFAAPALVYKFCTPEIKRIDNAKEISRNGLAEMGPVKRSEKILAVLFILAVLGWSTGRMTGINAVAVALGFLAFSLLSGIISWQNILDDKGPWSTLIWYGGIVGVASLLAGEDFFKWISDRIAESVNLTGYNSIAVLFVLTVISVLVRYLFASTAAYVAAFIPVLFTIGLAADVPPLPLAFMMAFSAGFGSLLTHYGGAVAPVLFGTGYVSQKLWWKMGAIMAVMNLAVYFLIGIPAWKVMGLW